MTGRWWMTLVVLFAGCAKGNDGLARHPIDFHQQVAPILKSHCLNCHGRQQQQGGLRLDERSFALQGGLSGRKLFGPNIDDSELWRRLTSDDPAQAMPKAGTRLDDSQRAILRRWIEADAPWPDKSAPSGRDEFLKQYSEDLWQRLAEFGGEPKVYWLLTFALLMGFAARIRRIPTDSERWSRGVWRNLHWLSRQISAAGFLAVLLGTACWDLIDRKSVV